MKRILIAVVLAVMAGGAYAADFSDLQNLKASDIKAENSSIALPGSPIKVMDGNTLKADQALAKLNDLSGATPYEKLKNLFNEGVPATKADLTGWYSGRSTKYSAPEAFRGALLIGKEEPANPDGGPLFSGDLLFKVSLPEYDPPGYFDNMSETVIAELKSRGPDSTITFPSAEGMITYANGNKGTLQYRKARGYIVEHFLRVNELEMYTYYFLNVTPK